MISFNIFKNNVDLIDSFNNERNQPYKLGINEFADHTNREEPTGKLEKEKQKIILELRMTSQ